MFSESKIGQGLCWSWPQAYQCTINPGLCIIILNNRAANDAYKSQAKAISGSKPVTTNGRLGCIAGGMNRDTCADRRGVLLFVNVLMAM